MPLVLGTPSNNNSSTTSLAPVLSQKRSSPTRKKGAILLIVLAFIALVLFFALGGPLALARIFSGTSAASSATVTITPSSADLKRTYSISVVTGTPDASQNQVAGARMVSSTTPPYTQTVNATGQGMTPGTHATGTLRVENHDPSNTLTLSAGTTFPNQLSPAIDVQLDQDVSLPPGGFTDGVAAHVVEVGTIGNLPGQCCGPGPNFQNMCEAFQGNCSQPHDIFNDSAFTGGTDSQTYSVVQQSDIDGAVNTLEQANMPNVQQILQGQVQANEQFIGTQQCTPNVTSDHTAGDQTTSVTVTVTFTCTGEVYSQSPALSLARQLLTKEAATNPGPGFALVGNITTTVTGATLSDAGQGTVAVSINAEGVWVYQFSATRQQALAKLLVNKKKSAAQALLPKQSGVSHAVIDLVGGDGTLFPADPRQIKIVIQNVPGV